LKENAVSANSVNAFKAKLENEGKIKMELFLE